MLRWNFIPGSNYVDADFFLAAIRTATFLRVYTTHCLNRKLLCIFMYMYMQELHVSIDVKVQYRVCPQLRGWGQRAGSRLRRRIHGPVLTNEHCDTGEVSSNPRWLCLSSCLAATVRTCRCHSAIMMHLLDA